MYPEVFKLLFYESSVLGRKKYFPFPFHTLFPNLLEIYYYYPETISLPELLSPLSVFSGT